MSVEELIMIFVLGPLLLIGGWIVVFRIWSGRMDVYADSWVFRVFVGRSARDGVNAMIPVATMCITLIYFGIIVVKSTSPGSSLGVLVDILFGGSLLALLLTFTELLFLFPRLAAPPYLRSGDHHGWIPTAFRNFRRRRPARDTRRR